MSGEPSVEVDPLIGEVLASRYKIEMLLGEGAMGAVYRARHVKVGRAFAVKVLHAHLLDEMKTAQRFAREAELAGRLRHPNVIGVVDVGETAGRHYMVMDFVEGEELASLLAEAPMPASRITNLVRQLLDGLFHAHEQGLIHRDFKPENVIVERDAHGHEVPRIVDFGIAILREGGDDPAGPGRLTTNGLVLGTPHYMAPEQAVGDPIDHRIDLFALGLVIYEMLCGKLPFDGSGAEIARANLMLDPPPIARRVPHLEVDPLLEAFARHLMAKRRSDRPPTARAARELLDLIERDRAAAAAVLGIAPVIVRPPAVTQDATPIPGTLKATDVQEAMKAPSMRVAPMIADASASETPTEKTAPASRRRGLVIGIVAATLVLGGGGIFLATRGHGEVAPIDAPAPAPVVLAPAVDAAVAVVEPPPPDAAPAPIDVAPKPTPVAKPKPKPAVATPPPPPPPPPTTEITVAQLVALYSAVGKEVEVLRKKRGDDAITEILPRYRLINLNDAMSSPDKRKAAFQVLTKIERDVRAK